MVPPPSYPSIRLMFCWTEFHSYEDARRYTGQALGVLSEASIADWYNFCGDLVLDKILGQQKGRGFIWGPGKIV